MSAQLGLFDAPAPVPPREIERWAELEPPYRWVLGRRWDPGLPTLAWIMLNPSKADGTDDDPTMGKVIEFTRLAGYGCCVVVNAFPFMATDPKDLLRVLAEDRERALGPMQTAADMGAEHLTGQAYKAVMSFAKRYADAAIISAICSGFDDPQDATRTIRSSATVLAWGANCPTWRALELLALLDEWNLPEHPLLALGYTKAGHPRHPLMMAYATKLEPFERRGVLASNQVAGVATAATAAST